ncbi:MAG: inositol monophosphatase family protein [Gammaproteobacteria bacterium]|nr:inositol monophosphatase family protein [Gammaproteobacteria bacterium]
MLPSLETLRDIVRTAARDELMSRFADVTRHVKQDGSVVTEADTAMQRRLQSDLAQRWPQYDFLGEEMSGTEHERIAALAGKGLWCVDPLDGTSNYATGIPFFSVSVALLIKGRLELGLVYDPVRDECFMARHGAGARLNDNALGTHKLPLPDSLRRCIAVVDFKRLTSSLAAPLAARPPYGSQRNFGASSLEWCWLADGRFQLYLHGGQKLWDYAGGNLILTEAGGRAATLEGEPVFSPGLAPRSVVAAVTPELFCAWQDWLNNKSLSAP